MDIGYLSPKINSSLSVKWKGHPWFLVDHELIAEDQISLFKEKFDGSKEHKSNKSMADGNYCNYLIDFNHKSPINRKLTPEDKSSSAKEDRD